MDDDDVRAGPSAYAYASAENPADDSMITDKENIIHPIGELVPSSIARVLRCFGVREIGGRERNRNSAWRYMCLVPVGWCVFSLQWTPVLMGLGHSFALSAFLPQSFLFCGMFLSVFSETAIFKSAFVGHRLSVSEADRRKMRSCWTSSAPMAVPLIMWAPMFLLVSVPVMMHKDAEIFDRAICLASAVLTPLCYFFIILPVQAWSPLSQIHIDMNISEVNRVCDRMLSILDDPKLSPQQAADSLSAIERLDARNLRQELQVWGRQSTALCFMALHGVTQALFTFFAPSDATTIRADPTLALGVRIWFATFSVLYFCPWAFAFASEAATPAKRWRQFAETVMRDAGTLRQAHVKFGGDMLALKEWLKHNTLCLHLGGFPIDETLAGKMLAVASSVVSLTALLLARSLGYYS
eukprot:g2883.t1